MPPAKPPRPSAATADLESESEAEASEEEDENDPFADSNVIHTPSVERGQPKWP